MLSIKAIACCISAAILFTAITSCQPENNSRLQQQTPCVQNGKPVTGPALLVSDGLIPVNYDTAICGFMPMHKNAYWIYTDSLFDINGNLTTVKRDTLKINGTYKSPGGPSLFWSFKSNSAKGFSNLMYTTDSVLYSITGAMTYPSYYIDFTWAGYPDGGYPHTGSINLAPPAGDTIYTGNFFTDLAYFEKIVNYSQPVTVPAGTYSKCIGFTKFRGYGEHPIYEMVFRPGVGMVQYKAFYPAASFGMYAIGPKKQVSVLTAYNLF